MCRRLSGPFSLPICKMWEFDSVLKILSPLIQFSNTPGRGEFVSDHSGEREINIMGRKEERLEG